MTGIVDVQTYVQPAMELVYERGTSQFRGQWPRLEEMLALAAPQPGVGDWRAAYLYLPPEASPHEAGVWPVPVLPEGVELPAAPVANIEDGILHDNPTGRLAAMDRAGVDQHLIAPGPSIDAVKALPSNLAAGVLASYNEFALTYCSRDPERLKVVIQVHAGELHWSAREIERLGGRPGVAGVSICLPVKLAPAEGLEPIWAAIHAGGLPLVQRQSFGARVWSPARYLAHLRRAGVLKRYPRLRIGFVGMGAAWLSEALASSGAEYVREALERGQIFAGLDGSESAEVEERLFEAAGGSLLWGSSFPYCRTTYQATSAAPALTEAERRAVLEGNPGRWLARGGC